MLSLNLDNKFIIWCFIYLILLFYYIPDFMKIGVYIFITIGATYQITQKNKLADYVFLTITLIFLIYWFLVSGHINVINSFRYFLGFILFYFFFKRIDDINFDHIFIILTVLIIIECLLINTIIDAPLMPNIPDRLYDIRSGNSHLLDAGYLEQGIYQRPFGPGGLASSTSLVYITVLLLTSRYTLIKDILAASVIMILHNGTGYLSFIIYVFFKRRMYFLSLPLLIPLLIYFDITDIFTRKIGIDYIIELIILKFGEINSFYDNSSLSKIILGSGNFTDQGGDFKMFALIRILGLAYPIFLLTWILTKVNRFNYLPLILLGIMSVHYGGVFSVPGQFLLAYLISQNIEEKKYG